jgi:hypothetical protein
MIFISYNASPLMHALKLLKQSLDYKDYWEKSIDYIISEINLKEYNNKSKEGIESFVLLWNIIANKNPMINNLETFMDYQSKNDEIRFSEKEIDGIIYFHVNKALGNYIREQMDYLNASFKDEVKDNIDRTRINHEDKKKNLENIYEEKYKNIIPNKIKEIKIDIYKFKDSFDNLKIKLRKYKPKCWINLFNKRKNKNKIIRKLKNLKKWFRFKWYNILLPIYALNNINVNEILNNIWKNKDWIIKELSNWLKASLVIVKKSDNIKNPNKIDSIFNIVLLDINKNIGENENNTYISNNNLINIDFNFNKNKLKNIFKNQKIT